MNEYVEIRDGGYWISGERISLDSIVYAFRRGQSPESIQQSFPLLSLEQIYGAVTFYLGNKDEVDRSILEDETEFNKMHHESNIRNVELYARIEKARSDLVIEHR